MPQTSSNVTAGNDAKASDFNKVVADLAEVYSGGPGVPIGGIIYWFSDNTIPLNYKECNGQTISDASSPINGLILPDLRDKFIRGVGNANLRSSPVAGGNDTVTLTINELPAHSHSQASHNHSIGGIYIENNKGYTGTGFNPLTNDVRTGSINTTGSANPAIGSTGNSQAFSILPGYRGMVPIIRYK